MKKNDDSIKGLSNYSTYVILTKAKNPEGNFVTIFEDFFTVKEGLLEDYMRRLMNDFSSPYYFYGKNSFLAKICDIDGKCGVAHHTTVPEILCPITDYINVNMRRYQQTIQVLNYTPQGFYKKSEEERKEIQELLDNAIVDYVSKYVAPDISAKITDEQIMDIKKVLNPSDNVKKRIKH